MEKIEIKIMVGDKGKVPAYMTDGASGADIYASENAVIQPGSTALIHTDVRIEIPEGYECQIRPRSGLALKHGITITNAPGTIDSDYRGEIMIIMHNLSDRAFTVNKHDRIAQMIFAPVVRASFKETTINNTQRSSGGFGHTGNRDD